MTQTFSRRSIQEVQFISIFFSLYLIFQFICNFPSPSQQNVPVPVALWLSVRGCHSCCSSGVSANTPPPHWYTQHPGGLDWVWVSPWDFSRTSSHWSCRREGCVPGGGLASRPEGLFFYLLFQAADKQSAKRISSRAGFETHRASAGRWPPQPRDGLQQELEEKCYLEILRVALGQLESNWLSSHWSEQR